MKTKIIGVIVGLLLIAFSSQAHAHLLWVNLYESFAHPPGHAIASIGWGHVIPMDDFLVSKTGSIQLAGYELIDPELKSTALPLLDMEMPEKIKTSSGMTFQSGDLGIRKFGLTEKTKPGTYQVVVTSRDNFFSKYLDKKGKQKWVGKAMDEIKGAQKVLTGLKYKSFAKAYFTVGKWTEPKALGHDLEIIPTTDLSNVHVGDMVSFEVTFMGRPLSSSPDKSLEYLTATSNAFGGPDGFFIGAMIFNGKAQFRMPVAGQWVVNIYFSQDVTRKNELKHLADKCTRVVYASTVSFHVKP